MDKLFVEFINKLENISGNRNLCEAILQGYLACHPIFEDAEGRAASKTREFIRKRFGEQVNSIARDENWEPILTANGKEQTVVDYYERQIRDMFFHNDYANIKFEPGVARIMFDDIGMQGENYDVGRTETLKGILKIISSAHADEYDANLNGMSFDELGERFGESMKAASNKDYEKVNSATYTKNDDYDIVEIHSFDEAEKYYEYTYSSSRWCLTHMENMWNRYTGYGKNKVYFVLKKGFEEIEPIKGENCPLDEYGLSMICVIVTNDINDDNRPKLITCTCRWNHSNGGSDGVMDVEQISNVVGESFYDAFKPFSLEELHSRGIYTFKEKIEKYNETHDKKLFDDFTCFHDGYAEVALNGKWSLIDMDGNLLWNGEKWFDRVGFFSEGYAKVELDGKCSFIDKDGELIGGGNKWFDDVGSFYEGYADVKMQWKGYNFIDKEGELLWKGEEWFDGFNLFDEGNARVQLNGKYNFINEEGNLVSKNTWFNFADDFHGGYARVELNKKYNFIDKEGKFLLKNQSFDYIDSFHGGYARVKSNRKWNFINKEGNVMFETWFDNVDDFKDGYCKVKLNKKWNLMDKDGNLMSKQWFDDINFRKDYAMVKLDKKWNFINKEGDLISDEWFDEVYGFVVGVAEVRNGRKYNFINKEGNLISDNWFDHADTFHEGYARVSFNKIGWNFIDAEGKFLSEQWFNEIGNFDGGYGYVKLNGYYNFIDSDGKFLSDQWFDNIHSDFNYDYFRVKPKNGKWNFLDKEGNLLFDKGFDDVGPFRDGYGTVTINGRLVEIDKEGNIVRRYQ